MKRISAAVVSIAAAAFLAAPAGSAQQSGLVNADSTNTALNEVVQSQIKRS